MAIDFNKLNFFNRLDARARILVLVGAVVGVILLVYLGTLYFWGGSDTTGPSRVASAPGGLQSVPGGQLTPEYQRALMQADAQAREQAQMRGGSAVPTLMNLGQQAQQTQTCIVCDDSMANVKDYLDNWVKQGKIAPDVAQSLQALADKNVSVDEYAAELDRLVKEGKLTPEQARQLLERYKKQHANAQLQESAKAMDDLIKTGRLPLDVANQLLAAQKNNIAPADYAAQLQDLVGQGKISPDVAQQLLSQYTQQRAKDIIMQSIVSLQRMARAGEITPEVESNLIDLERAMVPVDAYNAKLQEFMNAGKLVPASAAKIIAEYRAQKAAIGPTATINQMLQQAEAAAYQEISDLLKAGKITADVASLLANMIQSNVSLDQFVNTVNQLVQQNKLTPDIAKLKIADYQKVKGLRELAERLGVLQGNNAPPSTYADELKRAVQSGLLTPDQAAQLLQEYQAMTARAQATVSPAAGGTQAFADLQRRLQEEGVQTVPADQFAAAQVAVVEETAEQKQARIDAIVAAMSTQAGQLVNAWQPPTMVHREGSFKVEEKNGVVIGPDGKATTVTTTTAMSGAPLIKAGTILFGTLDTTVNSDYPDSPVMVTIILGKYKGARLLGKLVTTKGVAGQMDRVSLNFTLMNMDEWAKSRGITAYAIDPDTARTALATSVNYHYLKRFGAIMATSFLQGYATSITNEGTSTTGIFGTSSTHPSLSPSNKLMVGLGQIGQTLGNVTQNWVNIPPTVKVDSGVGLGILFMSDVT